MRRKVRLSVRKKMLFMALCTSAFALALMTLVVYLSVANQQRTFMYEKRQEQFLALTAVIGSRSTAAVVYDDPTLALENLKALNNLREKGDILLAEVRTAKGLTLARYQPGPLPGGWRPKQHSLPCSKEQAYQRVEAILAVCHPMVLDDELIGQTRLYFNLNTDLEVVDARTRRFLVYVILIAAVAVLPAFLLAVLLERHISAPLVLLRDAMEAVSRRGDYSVRVPVVSDDELGNLTAGFNRMLEEIMERDAALERYSGSLEQQVEARTKELEEANRRRVSWLESLAIFLRHELKNFIEGAKASLNLIERKGDPHGTAAGYVSRARYSITNMSKLLDSVSKASTLEAAVYKAPKSPVDLSVLAENAVQEYVEPLETNEVLLECEERLYVVGSELLITQMIHNLLSNAMEHRSVGTTVLVSLRKDNQEAVLSIVDEGEPLPEDVDQIFELFVTRRSMDRQREGNVGLGLSLVKLIAEAHGGRVVAEARTATTGAVFTVRLPVYDQSEGSNHL